MAFPLAGAAPVSGAPLASGATPALAATNTLAEGTHEPHIRAPHPAAGHSASTRDAKPRPSSDPDGALEQWEQQIGKNYVHDEQKLDAIDTWNNDQPSFESSGYLGAIEDASTFSITLLWHGSDAVLASAQAYAKGTGARVTVEQRPYSQSELAAAGATLWASRPALAAEGFELTEIVQVSGDVKLPVVHGVLNSSATAPTVLDSIEKLTGVRYILGDARSGALTTGRGDDARPFPEGPLRPARTSPWPESR
ncbi:hypothetical protein [uncultured Amnibacterium sp.]|uniref:hypothetical protein n=1 Tax=uncultured Amnibacterium sp. TaxID=1631851 RepID=UPI0035C964BF